MYITVFYLQTLVTYTNAKSGITLTLFIVCVSGCEKKNNIIKNASKHKQNNEMQLIYKSSRINVSGRLLFNSATK